MDLSKKTGPLTCSIEDLKKPPKNEWPPKAVEILVDMYVDKFAVGRTCLRSKDWEEIMERVNIECDSLKNAKQCRDKIDSLKRRYKSEYRKFVNGEKITWPFFEKLDSLSSASKQVKSFELLDRLHKPVMYSSHEINEGDDETLDDKPGSPEECGGVETGRGDMDLRIAENGKGRAEEKYATSEEGFDVNAYPAHPRTQRPPGVQLSPDVSSGQERRHASPRCRGASSKRRAHSRKSESDGSVQAVAGGLTGFPAILARIEVTKKELLTKIEKEFSRMSKKRRKTRHRRSASRTSFTNP